MITSKSNPLLKMARALRQRRSRHENDLFLIEGIQQVGSALEAGWSIEAVLYAPELLTSEFGHQLLDRFEGRVERVSSAALESVTEKEHPQGILAIARQRHPRLGAVETAGAAVALVSPQDPGNVGTILRTLDAVGGGALYLLDGGVDPYHPTAIRASMGAMFTIATIQTSFAEFLDWRRSRAIQLIGTSARGQVNYLEARPKVPWILLLGSEQKGLSESQMDGCDIVVALPMRGRATSLNLAVAAGVLLFAFTA